MTEERGRSADDRPTMGDVSHTNPYTNETFGGIYRRGPAVADGGAAPTPVASDDGEAAGDDGEKAGDDGEKAGDDGEKAGDAADEASDAAESTAEGARTMGEIDHTPRDLNVNNVWNRGSSRSVPGDD